MVSMGKLLGRIAVKSYTTFSSESDWYSLILLRKIGGDWMSKLSDITRKQLRAIAQKQAEKIEKEFE